MPDPPPKLAQEVGRFRADHRLKSDLDALAFLITLGLEAVASMAAPELLRRLIRAGAEAQDEPKKPTKR